MTRITAAAMSVSFILTLCMGAQEVVLPDPVFPFGAVYFRKSNPPEQDWERDHQTAANTVSYTHLDVYKRQTVACSMVCWPRSRAQGRWQVGLRKSDARNKGCCASWIGA